MKRCRKTVVGSFLVFGILFLASSFTFAYDYEEEGLLKKGGPITIRNQMPLYLFYLQMIPDVAEVTEKGKLTIDADYTVSSITVSAFTPATSLYDIEIDLEVSRFTLDLRYGLYDNLELGLEIPYISLSRGYLDGFVEAVEDGIGARTPRSRVRQGQYEFEYSFQYNNKYLIRKRHSTQGLGDMVFNMKYQLLREDIFMWMWPNVSMRSAIKFPTADKNDLLGSGELDYGFGILMDKQLFDRFFLYGGVNISIIEKPSFFDEIGVDNEFYSGMLALEYFFTRNLSLITQVSGNTTPYSYSDTNPLDNDAYEFGLGFNYRCKKKDNISWHFGFTENIKSASSPDVSFHTGLKWEF